MGQKRKLSVLVFLFIIALLLSLCIGRFPLSIADIFRVLGNQATPLESSVFWQLRLPRTILVLASGMALSVAGTALQKLFGNPLASPDIIGVTSGCSAGAALGIVLFSGSYLTVQIFSFFGGLAAMGFAIVLAGMLKTNRVLGLILAGIASSALSTAVIMIMKYLADPLHQLSSVDFWLMGGFYTASWKQAAFVLPIVIVGSVLLLLLSWQLQVLSYGSEQAKSLGISVDALRIGVLLVTTLMIAAVVSASGLISWVGLIAPHIANRYQKKEKRYHMIYSAIIGAALLLFADTIAKSLTANELPISIVTTLLGVPVLLYVTMKMKKQQLAK